MPKFTLRISITGLISIASIDDETRLLFPKTPAIPHRPFLFYQQKFLPHGSSETFDHCVITDKEINWTNISDDPPRRFTPSAALDLSHIEHDRKYSRSAAQGDGNGKLAARVSLHAGGLSCSEPGHFFTMGPSSSDQYEAAWLLRWHIAMDSNSLKIDTAPLKGPSITTTIQELFPVDGVIDVVFAHVPVTAIGSGPSKHYQAIYDLLGSGLKDYPTFKVANPAVTNKHCDYHLPEFEKRHLLTEAFQCYPSVATLI